MLCLAIVLCFASHSWRIALELLHHGCDLNVRICTKRWVFSGKRRLGCGEKLARLREGCLASPLCRGILLELRAQCKGGFQVIFSLLCWCCAMVLWCTLHVLRHFVQWNWYIQAMCPTVVCCNSSALCHSVCADRSGMAAPRLLEGYLFSRTVLQFWLCFASRCWWIALELLLVTVHHGCDLNVRICTKHWVFRVNGSSVAEKSWLTCATVAGVAALA